MRKVRILASQDASEIVLERLRDLEIMQVDFTRVSERNDAGQVLYQDKLTKLLAIKTYLERYNPIRRGFIDMFIGTKPEVTTDEFRKAIETQDVDGVFDTVNAHEARLKEIDLNLAELRNRIASLEDWRLLDLPVSTLVPSPSCDSTLATVPATRWAIEEENLLQSPIVWEKIWQKNERVGIWLLCLKDVLGTAASIVSSVGGTVVELPGTDGGLIEESIASLNKQVESLTGERQRILDDDAALSSGLLGVLSLMDYYLDRRNFDEAMEGIGKTVYTVVIDGYCKAKDVQTLRDALSHIQEIDVVDEEPGSEDDVPIVLENAKLIRPFEAVTNLFGFPHYREQDPTPWLASFFWVFFGLTLADVVYGVVLGAFCMWLLKTRKQLAGGGEKMVTLLLYCSVSMIILGVLMGSWLGDSVSAFFPGSAFDKLVRSMTILDPINDPLTLMIISLALGVIHIWVGILVKALGNIKSGNLSEAVWGQFSWMIFLPGIIIWGLTKAGIFQSQIPFYVMITGVVMIMYGSSRGTRQIYLKPFSGAYGLYGSVAYFADVLSYTRLLALGLASAIIGVVVNKIAYLAVTMIPVLGWVVLPIVLLVGHMFNLVINLLGSYIHSGRLQFVEFFTKFFEGGGKPFRPLRRVNQNVALNR